MGTRTDGGLALGAISLTTLDAGRLLLTAGWSGGPQAQMVVHVLPVRSVEVLGGNPPSYGVNTAEFEPNDPDGLAWRRDDVVPIRTWRDAQISARQLQPGASRALLDAGTFDDGGAFFRLEDIQFNAFRDQVEFRAVTESWESAPQQLTVTRWRWRRVVTSEPNPLKVHRPAMGLTTLPSETIIVGTEDSPSTGSLVSLDERGQPAPSDLPTNWTAAVTAPVLWPMVAGYDGDAGFIWSGNWTLATPTLRGEKFVLLNRTTHNVLAVTDRSGVFISQISNGPQTMYPQGNCGFDAGPASMITGSHWSYIRSNSNQLCITQLYGGEDAGATSLSTFGSTALAGESWIATDDGRVVNAFGTNFNATLDGGFADFISKSNFYLFVFRGSEALRYDHCFHLGYDSGFPLCDREPWALAPVPVARSQLGFSFASRPILRDQYPFSDRGEFYLVDQTGRVRALSHPSLTAEWSWRPDGGVGAPSLGLVTSAYRMGSLLIPYRSSVVSIVVDARVSDPIDMDGFGGAFTTP